MYYIQVLFRDSWLCTCTPYPTEEEGREALRLRNIEYHQCKHRLVKCEVLDG